MILSVTGSSNSGKSTFVIKLAKAFAEEKKNVAVVMTDYYAPTFVTFFPEDSESGSLGRLLSQPNLTQGLIEKEMNLVKGENYIVFFSYQSRENRFSYANYTKQKTEDFLYLLKHMADIILVDCQTAIYDDVLSQTAIEMSDNVFSLIRADLKGLSYQKSNQSLYSAKKKVEVIVDVDNSKLAYEVGEEIGNVSFYLPYCEEIKNQFLEENILKKLSRKGKEYEAIMNKIVKSLE